MALPTTFGPLTAAQLVQLDNNFNAVGAMGITACTAVSANTISLTPLTNQPAVSAYANYQQFGFVAAATSTSAVTAAVGTLPFINLYLADGTTQAGNTNIQANQYYTIVYNAALNGGVGAFQLLSQMAVSNLLDSVQGAAVQGTILYRGATSWTSLAPGASGQVLQSQGASANLTWANASGGGTQIVRAITFTTAGSFSFSSPSGLASTTVVKVTLVGGGGGGSGGGGPNDGAGGGAGALAIGYISGLSANTVYSGAVGNGGNGGGSAPTVGSGGGTTTVSFGGLQFTAAGGGGGLTSGVGGTGGTGANTTFFYTGEAGWAGIVNVAGGPGASGPFGGGAPWQPTATTAGFNAAGIGAGGGGGQGVAGGGSGTTGIFVMEWVQ